MLIAINSTGTTNMDADKIKAEIDLTRETGADGDRTIARTFLIPFIDRYELLQTMLEELSELCHDRDILFWVRLSVDEAVINAITHGHREDINAPRTPVRVDYVIDDRSIAIRVTDSGLGFDPSNVPDPTLDENLFQVTGRGIFLMRQSMDRVVYNSVGNSVLLVRQF